VGAPDITPIQHLINSWILVAQALVGSIGALAFVLAFMWKVIATEPRSVTMAKQWIQRIVVGTLGVEMATLLAKVLTDTAPK
jgi:hypothetical protein